MTLNGLDVPPVEIGFGQYVSRPSGTVVMARRIGANVSLIRGITLGIRAGYDFLTIGAGRIIGAGARILGGVTVGDGTRICANFLALKDVPDGATAVDVPSRILGWSE